MATPKAPVAWVTGASGFIGSHVANLFANKGYAVVRIDRMRAAAPDQLTLEADIDAHSLGAAYDMAGPPVAIFHGAGNGSVGRSISHPKQCKRDTLDSTKALLGFLLDAAPRARVVFPSSAAVYGTTDDVPLREDRKLAPVSPYGEHKMQAEDACLKAAAKGQPIAILRMFSVYGPRLRKQLPWELGRKILTGSNPIELFGTGTETRDFLSVHDAAAFIVALATTDHPSPLTVNGATGRAVTVADFAHALAKALDAAPQIGFNNHVRTGDPTFLRADLTRLQGLGLKATTDLETGLAEYAAYLRSPEGQPKIVAF